MGVLEPDIHERPCGEPVDCRGQDNVCLDISRGISSLNCEVNRAVNLRDRQSGDLRRICVVVYVRPRILPRGLVR